MIANIEAKALHKEHSVEATQLTQKPAVTQRFVITKPNILKDCFVVRLINFEY